MSYDNSAWANYPGRPNHSLQLYVRRNQTDEANNRSTYAWELIAYRNSGAVSWHNDPLPWSVNVAGYITNGRHGLAFSSGVNRISLGSGETGWIGHDGNGYLNIWFSANHGGAHFGVAQTGSTQLQTDRIPKPPQAPTAIGLDEATASSLRFRFSGNSDNGAGMLEWQAQIATDPGFYENVRTVGSNGTTVFTGLAPGRAHYARARGRNRMGWSGWSGTASANTLAGVPSAPTFSQTRLRDFAISWRGDSPTYDVQVSRNADMSGASTFPVTGSSYNFGGSYLHSYYARVRATYPSGASNWSPIAGPFTMARAPYKPTVQEAEQTGPTSFRITWDEAASGGAPLTGYTLQLATSPTFPAATTVQVAATPRAYEFTGLTPGSAYFVRIAGRNTVTEPGADLDWSRTISTLVFVDVPLDGWTAFGTIPNSLRPLAPGGIRRGSVYSLGAGAPTGLLREIIPNGSSGTIAQSMTGFQRTIATVPGRTYHVDAWAVALDDAVQATKYKLGIMGVGSGETVTIGGAGDEAPFPRFTFTATAESHVLRIYIGASTNWDAAVPGYFEAVGFYNLTVTEIRNDSYIRLSDTVYEGPLSTHFSWTCQSAGGVWWVGRDSVTRFRENAGREAVKATFTDSRTPGALEYVDVVHSWDTKNVVNTLDAVNHGMRDNGLADDETLSYFDPDSIAANGVRPGKIDTVLHRPSRLVNGIHNPRGLLGTDYWWIPTQMTRATGQEAPLALDRDYALTADKDEEFIRATTRVETTSMDVRPATDQDRREAHPALHERFPALAGETFLVAGEFRTSHPEGRIVRISVDWRDRTGRYLETTSLPDEPASADWSRIAANLLAPPGSRYAVLSFRLGGNAVLPEGATFDVTRAQWLPAENDPGYLDGDTPDVVYDEYDYDSVGRSWLYDYNIVHTRLNALVDDHANPEYRISRLRWNAQENPSLAAQLEIQDRVTAHLEGVEVTDYRIVGMRHEVSGERWMIDLDVIPNKVA